MKLKNLAGIVIVLCSSQLYADEKIRERVGVAKDSKTGEMLYTESHLETYRYCNIIKDEVSYRDPDNNIIASKEVDYTVHSIMPDFKLVNHKTGHLEQATKSTKELTVKFTRNDSAEITQKTIELPEQAIIDAGFDQFVIKHWNELIEGRKLVRKMLIPSMQTFIEFRIYQFEVDRQKNERTLIVEPNSFLVRFVADELKLKYDFDKPRLYSFEGISNMRDSSGENYKVIITFERE